MDFEHCDDYETFLQTIAFDEKILKTLYERAVSLVEPLAQNVIYTEEDDIQDALTIVGIMYGLIHTGIPHYHSANLPQIYIESPCHIY